MIFHHLDPNELKTRHSGPDSVSLSLYLHSVILTDHFTLTRTSFQNTDAVQSSVLLRVADVKLHQKNQAGGFQCGLLVYVHLHLHTFN